MTSFDLNTTYEHGARIERYDNSEVYEISRSPKLLSLVRRLAAATFSGLIGATRVDAL